MPDQRPAPGHGDHSVGYLVGNRRRAVMTGNELSEFGLPRFSHLRALPRFFAIPASPR